MSRQPDMSVRRQAWVGAALAAIDLGGVESIAAKAERRPAAPTKSDSLFVSAAQIALLLIYPKNEQDDLSADERKALKQIIETWR